MRRPGTGVAAALALALAAPCAAAPGAATPEGCGLDRGEWLRRIVSLPGAARGVVAEHAPRERYEIDVCHLNPFFLRGDFDGDGKADHVIQLAAKDPDGRSRLAVVHGSGALSWLDRDGGLDYPPPDVWSVEPGDPLPQSSFEDRPPPALLGEVIVMRRFEASASILYWDGERFRSYWVGD